MRKNSIKFVAAIFLVFAGSVFADNQNMMSVFDKLKESKNAEAIDQIYSNNKWQDRSDDGYIITKQKFDSVVKQLGKFKFHELVLSQEVGKRFTRDVYVVGYERQPIYMIFDSYKPENEWVVIQYSWRTNFSDLAKDNIVFPQKTDN